MKPPIKNKNPGNQPKISAYEQQFKEANRLLMLGKGVMELEIYINLLREQPMDTRAWVGVGMPMTQQSKHALETLEFVLTHDPHNADSIYSLSAVEQAMGNHPGSRAGIDAACMAAPDNWMINHFKGVCIRNHWRKSVRNTRHLLRMGSKICSPARQGTKKSIP